MTNIRMKEGTSQNIPWTLKLQKRNTNDSSTMGINLTT